MRGCRVEGNEAGLHGGAGASGYTPKSNTRSRNCCTICTRKAVSSNGSRYQPMVTLDAETAPPPHTRKPDA
eukprot:3933161-Rhodomonas_salina.5